MFLLFVCLLVVSSLRKVAFSIPESLCQETRGLSVARATPEHGQKGVKEKPLILTFSQPIEDHVNQDVGSTPAGSVAAERRRHLIGRAHQTGR